MNKHIVVRTPIDIDSVDLSKWNKQVYLRKWFYENLTIAQREFFKSIYSWYLDFSGGSIILELTVLNEQQATLARMMF